MQTYANRFVFFRFLASTTSTVQLSLNCNLRSLQASGFPFGKPDSGRTSRILTPSGVDLLRFRNDLTISGRFVGQRPTIQASNRQVWFSLDLVAFRQPLHLKFIIATMLPQVPSFLRNLAIPQKMHTFTQVYMVLHSFSTTAQNPIGVEPTTFSSTGSCSDHLS